MALPVLACVCVAHGAQPGRVLIGGALSANLVSSGTAYYDSTGRLLYEVVISDPYVGPGFFAEYRPWSNLGFRLNLAEFQCYLKGGCGIMLFPDLDLEASLSPPCAWRVLPYACAGLRFSLYCGSRPADTRFMFPGNYRLRLGLGSRVRVGSRCELLAELQLYETEKYTGVDPLWGPYQETVTSVAVDRVRIGLAYHAY
ncbi:MAG: hypothetical protein ABIL25_09860 [candidate division WOR-3 bacterium]